MFYSFTCNFTRLYNNLDLLGQIKLIFKMNQKFGVKAVLIKNRPNINSYFAILEA